MKNSPDHRYSSIGNHDNTRSDRRGERRRRGRDIAMYVAIQRLLIIILQSLLLSTGAYFKVQLLDRETVRNFGRNPVDNRKWPNDDNRFQTKLPQIA